MNRVVVLGDGLLASELIKQTGWDYLSRKKDGFDITNPVSFKQLIEWGEEGAAGSKKYDIVINCIANTDTYSQDRKKHWDVNYAGVSSLVDLCNIWNIKLVHISSDYVYANSVGVPSEEDVPVHQGTYYAYTKLLADGLIELKARNYLVIRTTHKPKPFPYNAAWANQIGCFDYVDKIASLIAVLVSKNAEGIYNVGTESKSMLELAQRTKPDVDINYISNTLIPLDTTMNINKLTTFLNEN
jgi:dTDP-4-dehydrorhamnose reductase